MKKSKIIKEILGSVLLEKGFNYRTESNIWFFEREYQNKADELINQQIYVQENRFDKSLFFRFQTNAYGRLMYELKFAENKSWFAYETEQEFKDLIKYFADFMEPEGFNVLEQISEPTVTDRPTARQEEYLYQNYKTLSSDFMKEHEIGFDCGQARLTEVVFNIINSLKNESYSAISDSLIKLAAFYGEWLLKNSTGQLLPALRASVKEEKAWDFGKNNYTSVIFTSKTGFQISVMVLGRVFVWWLKVQEFNEREYKEILPGLLCLDQI
jgi:hypothetical protein